MSHLVDYGIYVVAWFRLPTFQTLYLHYGFLVVDLKVDLGVFIELI